MYILLLWVQDIIYPRNSPRTLVSCLTSQSQCAFLWGRQEKAITVCSLAEKIFRHLSLCLSVSFPSPLRPAHTHIHTERESQTKPSSCVLDFTPDSHPSNDLQKFAHGSKEAPLRKASHPTLNSQVALCSWMPFLHTVQTTHPIPNSANSRNKEQWWGLFISDSPLG